MKRVVLIVHGDVQRVGYRDIVSKIAIKSGITGEVKNFDDLDVQIIAEGEDDNIQSFIQAVQIQEFPINVESIHVEEGKYSGTFHSFRVIRGDPAEEIAERMDTAIQFFADIRKYSKHSSDNSDILIDMMHTSLENEEKMLDKQDKMLDKQDQMLDKQDKMLNKQDQMLDKQDKMLDLQGQMLTKQDMMVDKQVKSLVQQEHMEGKQDQMIAAQNTTTEEIRGLRSDFSQTFNRDVYAMRIELKEVRDALVKAGLLPLNG